MKTIKSLVYALVAVAALAFAGCTKDESYSAGGDLNGERIYIDNSTEIFYVLTAEEKLEKEKQLEKLSRGLKQAVEPTGDDKSVTIDVLRMNSKLAAYTTNIDLTLGAEYFNLFKMPAGATQTGADQGNKTVTYSFEVAFAEGEEKASFEIGFDIAQLDNNFEYEMTAEVNDEGNTSNYGASKFDFAICHKVALTYPYKEIGKIEFSESGYGFTSYKISIEVNENDYKAWKEEGKQMPYIRYRIPKYMYQVIAASVEAGDGNAEEGDLEYFENCHDILFNLTTDYNFIYDYDNQKYAHPLAEDITKGGSNILFGLLGLDSATGTISTKLYDGNLVFNQTLRGGWYFYPGESKATRTSNIFHIDAMLADMDSNSLYGNTCDFDFIWLENSMEDDWANFFTTDYNNEIDYVKADGAGTFSSTAFPSDEEGEDGNKKPQTWAQDLYKGVDVASGKNVFYLPNVYSTVSAPAGEEKFGLAVLVSGGVAEVASSQPLNMEWNGNAILASQSDKIASKIEYADDGSLKKLTLGVALHLENGNVLGDYTETYEFNSTASGVAAFYGTYTQQSIEVYSPYGTDIDPQPSLLTSTVKISQATDAAGQAVEGKVFIEGWISPDYLMPEYDINDGRLVGSYDAVTNSIIIPAQFFYKPVWKDLLAEGLNAYPYFQPGVGSVGAYNTNNGPMYISEISAQSESCALYMSEDGVLKFKYSTSDFSGNQATSYAISLYYIDTKTMEMTYGDDYFAPYVCQQLVPAGASGASVKAAAAKRTMPAISDRVKAMAKASNGVKKAYEFEPVTGKVINPEMLGK